MVLGMVYLYSPFMAIPLYSVFKSMPDSLVEASEDLGYNKFKTLFKVVVPYSLKAIFAGLGIVFMLSATSLVITNTLVPASSDSKITDGSEVLIGNVIGINSSEISVSDLSAQKGSTIALITILVMMAVYAVIYLIPIILRKIRRGVNV